MNMIIECVMSGDYYSKKNENLNAIILKFQLIAMNKWIYNREDVFNNKFEYITPFFKLK